MRSLNIFFAATLVAFLAGCGGKGGTSTPSAPISSAPTSSSSSSSVVSSLASSVASSVVARGELIQNPIRTLAVSADAFTTQLNGTTDGRNLLQLTGIPACGIDVRYVQYGTVGAVGEPTTASGVLMVPTGSSANCTGARPIVLYAHGTALSRRYNLANMRDDTNAAQSEAYILAALYAAQGYIVVAPNYAGYDSSTLPYHPYLNADQQSKEMMDVLAAAKQALPTLALGASAGTKLFVTGYSEGGHVAMATHRAMQAVGIPVTASAPMSGPYAFAAQADALLYGYVNQGGVFNSTLIVTSMQKAYGNIYPTPSDFYEAAYAPGIETSLPSLQNLSELIAAGKLPKTAVLSSEPLVPAVIPVSAPLAGAEADALFASGFGANNLVKNSVRQAYLVDAAANPDGVFPTMTNGLPSAAPANALRIAVKKNDLRGWTPASPVLLCGGNGDPQVFFKLHTKAMEALWADLPAGRVTVLDVDSLASSQGPTKDPYYAAKAGFAQAKAAIATQPNGSATVFEVYHTDLVFPFCNAAARSFFSQF